MNGPAHRSSAHRHTMLSFPPLTIFLLAGLGMSFQECLHIHLQRGFFPRRTPRNGSWQNVSCLTSLLEVAFNGRPRDPEAFDDLSSRCPFINCTKDLLSHFLRIGSHVSIMPPGSIFSQTPGINKLPLGNILGYTIELTVPLQERDPLRTSSPPCHTPIVPFLILFTLPSLHRAGPAENE